MDVADLAQVAGDFGGVFADGGGDALERKRDFVALFAGVDAEFTQALKLPRGGIRHGLNHLIEVFAHGRGGVAIAGEGLAAGV